MQSTDMEQRLGCSVIPFHKPEPPKQEEVAATSIATVIAVTVLHPSSESPEDRLIGILEQSGDVELLDASDAFAEFDAKCDAPLSQAVNDNEKLRTV